MKIARIVFAFAAVGCVTVSPWNSVHASGARAHISSASQSRGFSRPKPWLPKTLQPESTYVLDDGVSEDALAFSNGAHNFECIWFNHFNVIAGQTRITAVEIAWGSDLYDQQIDGSPVTIGIWSDPDGDGTPNDAVLLASIESTVQKANTDTFVSYVFSPPVELPSGATSFFVGDLTPMNDGPVVWFTAIDETLSQRSSWVAAKGDFSSPDFLHLGNNDFLGVVDDLGYPGNFLIRTDSTDAALFGQSAMSLKGDFAIDLPLVGTNGVEDRSGGRNGQFSIVISFNQEVVSLHGASSSCGKVKRVQINSADPHQVIIDLTGVTEDCNASEVTVIVEGVTDAAGDFVRNTPVTVGLLGGDVMETG